MELFSAAEALTFRALQSRLLALVNAKIRNGEFSERRLAILLGVSQPHLHNVLKGDRSLRISLADILLEKFEISVTDLITGTGNSGLPLNATPEIELARLRKLRKAPAAQKQSDRSAWQAG